ncbi:DUF2812 domain-containing protein [Clostridium sp. CX1]|uniref:DUF2812 domain-containing protein n=1 Tax=Clostridium sp. CX1 TaxID=2978346 RepID=UPI0021BF00CF|nr:DUF2812 domain-containing protein [Clostridium sp. CX1]MCT8975071.1 DUF2812 domain-containing protein [Clostridium sp. CX1]
MKQFKVFADFEQEEQYLNDMAQKGFEFVKRSSLGLYHFKKSDSKNRCYKVDYRIFNKKSDFLDYISIFEDSGWKHIYGTQGSGQQYFLKLSKQAISDIFSDEESRAERYIRLQKRCLTWVGSLVLAVVVVLISVKFNLSELFFLTPGLWQKEGNEFWRAFWFEFPFMLMRVLPVAFCAIGAILYGYWARKAKKSYEKFLSYKKS